MRVDDALLERMAKKRLWELADAMFQMYKKQYPKQCRIIGEKALKRFCKQCVDKADTYGANNYRELKAYASLAWVLGTGFDDDPLYPWITETLAEDVAFEERIEEIADRVQELYFFERLEQLQAYDEALKSLLQLNFAAIKKFTSYMDVVRTLEHVYPQRVEALGGSEVLKEHLKHACYQKTIRYNIDHPIGILVYAGLVFFLGHQVDDDPLYGWANKYLNADEPRMAHKLDRLIKVIEKRVRNMRREIKMAMEALR